MYDEQEISGKNIRKITADLKMAKNTLTNSQCLYLLA